MGRLRNVAVAATVAVLAVQVLAVMPATAQKVSNPSGPFTYTIHNGSLRIGTTPFDFDDTHVPQCSDGINNDADFLGTTAAQDTKIDFSGGDPECTSAADDSEVQAGFQPVAPITITGTVGPDGTWTVNPTTGVSFQPAYAWAVVPVLGTKFIITIQIVGIAGSGGWTGSINPLTGVATMPMNLQVQITGSPVFSSGCHIGDNTTPLLVQASSAKPGGAPYNSTPGQLGSVTMADHSFNVPQASGCSAYLGQDVQGQLNSSFGLPTSDTDASFNGEFPASNKPLAAITAPTLSVTPAVSCRTTTFTEAGGASTRPIASYGLDATNDGTIDQTTSTPSQSFTYANSGPVTARVRVSDNQGDFVDVLKSFTVPPNLAPTAPAINTPRSAVGADVPFTLTGSDPEGGPVTQSVLVGPAHGTLTGTAPNFTYHPAPGFQGTDSLTYKVSDDCAESGDTTGTVTFHVNQTPTATTQTINGIQEVPVSFALTGTDPDSDPLSFTVASNPTHGTLDGTAPNLQYTPDAGFNGLDSFTFTANDGLNTSAPGTITLNIVKNTRPVADAQIVTIPEDTPDTLITLTGSDADGDGLAFSILGSTSNGTLSGTAPLMHYTPNANFHGTDSFTFQVNDGKGGLNTATVTINVTSVNDVPVANDQSFNLQHDTSKSFVADVTDVDGDTLGFSPTTNVGHGVITGTFPNLTYTPTAGYIGGDTLVYTVDDGHGGTASATVHFTVTATNQPPSAPSSTVNTNEDTSKAVHLNAVDPEGDPVTIVITQAPTHGHLDGTAPDLTYVPDADYFGPDSFKYSVTDLFPLTSNGTISINVLAVNDAPVATAQTVSTNEDTAKPIILSSVDVDDTVITYQLITTPAHGTVTGTAPNVTYTPLANYNGPDSFTFRARDPKGATGTATVTVNVISVNDAPKATALSKTTAEDTSVATTLAGTDVDGDPLTYSVATAPAHGHFTGTAPTLTYVPNANYNGTDTFTFTAFDGSLTSAPAVVTLAITAVNDAPVANPQSGIHTLEDTAKPITLTGGDVDGDSITYRIEAAPAHGKLTGSGANVTYTPAADYNGPDSFTFSVTDPKGAKGIATVAIVVDPAPMIATAMTADPIVGKFNLLTLKITFGNLTAHLTRADTHGALSGRTVVFTVGAQAICTAVTNSAGTAACNGNSTGALVQGGKYTATFAGDADFSGSTAQAGIS